MIAEQKSVLIALDERDLGSAQDLARSLKVDLQIQPGAQFLDPLTAILVAGGALLVATFVVELIDKARGGMIIDLDPDAEHLARRDRSVPAGWVVIVDADGKSVKIETHDAPKGVSERLLERIIDGTFKTATDIAKAATEALGVGKVQEEGSSSSSG